MNEHDESRYVYIHLLYDSTERWFGQAKILNWTNSGLKFECKMPTINFESFRVRFHIEKAEQLTGYVERLEYEGKLEAAVECQGNWTIDILFDHPLSQVATERMGRYLNEEVSCYLFISECVPIKEFSP